MNHAQYESERVSIRMSNGKRAKRMRESESPSINKVNVINPVNIVPLKKKKTLRIIVYYDY